MKRRIILSLCDASGVWSRPYLQRGYEVVMVDLKHPRGEWRAPDGSWRIGVDLRDFEFPWQPWGVLAAPSCTCFCRPGACRWPEQDASGRTAGDVALMRACLAICQTAAGWWALENPPGRHQRLIPELGRPAWQYHPYEYGDPWKKQTYIWGTAKRPPVAPVEPEPTVRMKNGKVRGRIDRMSSSWKSEREQTPAGFARAFRLANP